MTMSGQPSQDPFSDLPLPPADPAPNISGKVKALKNALRFGDFHSRWDLAKQISAWGEDSLGDLLDLLQDPTLDQDSRWLVVRSLGQFDHPLVIAALVNLFASTDEDEMHAAIGTALAEIGPNAIAALTALLPHAQHRLVAVQALARIHHPATVPPLVPLVQDPDVAIRATALEAVAARGDVSILPVIVYALEDESARVRLTAVRGLVSCQRQVSPQQLVDWLTPRLGDGQLTVAQQAIYGLGRLQIEAATTALLTLGADPAAPPPLQVAVIQALGWQGTAAALAGLIELWEPVGPQPRLEIIRALEQLPPGELRSQASDHLQQWLGQLSPGGSHSPLRRQMVLALGKLGNPSVATVLRSHLNDPDPGVRLHAEAALASLGQAP